MEGAIWGLKSFADKHGAEGIAELNSLASTHTITIYPDLEKRFSYSGVDIREGVLRIVFKDGCLGTNVDYSLQDLAQAISIAGAAANGPDALSYAIRHGIKEDWDANFEELHKKLIEQTHNDKLELVPNWEANAAMLRKGGKDVREDWENVLGDYTKRYFEGLHYQMSYQKFAEDDLLYEGFNEAVSTGKVELRVVEKLKNGTYSEIFIEDGVFVLQVGFNFYCLVDLLLPAPSVVSPSSLPGPVKLRFNPLHNS